MAAADHFHVGSGSNHKNEYRPRNPEDSLLYRTIAGHLETFLAHQRERGREVPHFVEREMRAYLSCSVLACGFLRSSVNRAARIGCCRCLARADPFVPPVAEGAWSTQRRTLSIECFLACLSASGFSHCRSPCATVWPTTRKW